MSGQEGSSTLEFVFCAPMLLVLLYVAFEVNERIEQRSLLAIATQNAIWIEDPKDGETSVASYLDQGNASPTLSTVWEDVLGQPGDGPSTRMATTSSPRKDRESYDLQLLRRSTPGSDKKAADRAVTPLGSSFLDKTSQAQAIGSSAVMGALGPMTQFLFPQQDIEQQTAVLSLKAKADVFTNMQRVQSLIALLQMNLEPDAAMSLRQRLMYDGHAFLFRDAGYQSPRYQRQGVAGLAIGWGDKNRDMSKKFVEECLMNFKRDLTSSCDEQNDFYLEVENLFRTIAAIKAGIYALNMSKCAALLVGAPACFVGTAVQDFVMNKIIDEAVAKATNELATLLEDQLNKFFEDKMNQAKKAIQESAGDLLKGVTDVEDKFALGIENLMKPVVDNSFAF